MILSVKEIDWLPGFTTGSRLNARRTRPGSVEIVGYEEEVRPLVKFTHTLSLVAQKGSAQQPAWSVRVTLIAQTGDRDYAAQMLRAAQSYIGKGGDAVEVTVAQNDPGLIFILAGAPERGPGPAK